MGGRARLRWCLLACVCALTVVMSVGVGSASAHTKAAGIVSADDDPSLNATETLLSSIAAGDRERCYQVDPKTVDGGIFAAAAAGIECDDPADGINIMGYFLYSDPAALAADYATTHPGDTPAASSTSACDGTQGWNYHGSSSGGEYACFAEPESKTMQVVWTATDQNILGLAAASDGTVLMKWWNSSAGPLQHPDTVTNFTGGASEHKAATKELLASVGKGITNCESKLGLVAPGDTEWAWYPWLQSAEACSAPQHGSVYLAQLDPASAQAFATYFEKYTLVNGAKTSKPKACAARDITNDKNKVVGSVSCLYVGKTLYALWYTTDDGVVGAAHVDTTPKKLFAYVNQNKLL